MTSLLIRGKECWHRLFPSASEGLPHSCRVPGDVNHSSCGNHTMNHPRLQHLNSADITFPCVLPECISFIRNECLHQQRRKAPSFLLVTVLSDRLPWLLYVSVLPAYVCVHMCADAQSGQRRYRTPWDCSYRWLQASMRVLETKPSPLEERPCSHLLSYLSLLIHHSEHLLGILEHRPQMQAE